MFILDGESGKQAEEQPGSWAGGAISDAQQHEHRCHPETGFERIHREVVRRGQEDRGRKHGCHGEYLSAAATAQLPGEDAGERDKHSRGYEAKDANPGRGKAEERFGHTCLERYEGRLIHVTPS